MRFFHQLRLRLRSLFARRWVDDELDAELRFHLEQQINENIAGGMTPEEARYAALRTVGRVSQLKEECRDMRRVNWIENFVQDLRFAARMLRKNPAFTVVAIITLALGIGVNSAMFAMVNAFLFRPLPVKHAVDLVAIGTRDRDLEIAHEVSYPNYADLRDHSGAFEELAATANTVLSLSVDGHAERLWTERVSGNYFSTLGVEAELGRVFTPVDGADRGAQPIMVLTHAFWQRRFAGDRGVIGRSVRLNGRPFTIIGVLPPEFLGTDPMLTFAAFVPLGTADYLFPGSGQRFEDRGNEWMRLYGRLKPGVSVASARAALDVLARRMEQQYPKTNHDTRWLLVPEIQSRPVIGIADKIPAIAAVFMALVALVLLITCANVANLSLARAVARSKETAMRSALGASRLRLAFQILTESLLIALAGGATGLLVARWAVQWLMAIRFSVDAPVRLDFHPDLRVFAYTLLVVMATAMLAGIVPALRASRADLNDTFKQRSNSLAGSNWTGSALVVAQVTVTMLLLVGAALFAQSTRSIETADLGFRRDHQLMMSVDLSLGGYDETRGRQFLEEWSRRARALPGVDSAALAGWVPLGYNSSTIDVIPEGAVRDESRAAFYADVGTAYFRTMGVPLLTGREFTDLDDASAPHVAVVNQAFARQYWPDSNAIGKRFRLLHQTGWVQVVGVAVNGKYLFVNEDPRPFVYLPLKQSYDSPVTLHLRTTRDPGGLAAAASGIIHALDPDLPVYDVKTMDAHLHDGLAFLPVRIGTEMAATFGLLGLVLASVGVYGVVSYAVSQRTREIGIRMALGARPSNVASNVVRRGAWLVAIGLALGLPGAYALARVLSGVLYQVRPGNPAGYAGAVGLIVVVAIIACAIPAWRATRVDPLSAIRQE